MRTVRLGEDSLSVIGLGTWPMDGRDWGACDDAASVRVIRAAIDHGITLFDTAPAYGLGHSEEVLGRALEGLRDRVVIATKAGIRWNEVRYYQDLSPSSVRWEVEQSLRRLRTDVLDILQVHWPHAETALEDTLATFEALRREGKIRHVGVSNFDVPLLARARAAARIETQQPPLHLFFRNAEREILPYGEAEGILGLVYGSLCKGLLTGKFHGVEVPNDIRRKDPFFGPAVLPVLREKVDRLVAIAMEEGITPAQLALAWTLTRPGVGVTLVGARTIPQVEENAAAGEIQLSASCLEAVERCVADVPPIVPM